MIQNDNFLSRNCPFYSILLKTNKVNQDSVKIMSPFREERSSVEFVLEEDAHFHSK